MSRPSSKVVFKKERPLRRSPCPPLRRPMRGGSKIHHKTIEKERPKQGERRAEKTTPRRAQKTPEKATRRGTAEARQKERKQTTEAKQKQSGQGQQKDSRRAGKDGAQEQRKRPPDKGQRKRKRDPTAEAEEDERHRGRRRPRRTASKADSEQRPAEDIKRKSGSPAPMLTESRRAEKQAESQAGADSRRFPVTEKAAFGISYK